MTSLLPLEPTTAELPPRGAAVVTSENRADIRRALCALGLPSAYVRALSLHDLARIYNDTTDAALRFAIANNPQPAAAPTTPAPLPSAIAGHAPDVAAAAAALAAALAAAQPSAAPIDADAVREIVRAETAALAAALAAVTSTPPTIIHVRQPSGETITLDGPQHRQLPHVLRLVDALRPTHRNVWLSGPAGTGKSTFAQRVAAARGLAYRSIGAITSSYQLLGFRDATGNVARTPFRDIWENGGVFCWDDIDSSDPGALIEFNEATANGICNFPDGPVSRHPDCIIIATANTTGDGGTAQYIRARQDAATLDRFRRVRIDYDPALERQIIGATLTAADADAWCAYWTALRKSADTLGMRVVLSMRGLISGADMLAAGLTLGDVMAANLRDAMPADQYDRLIAGAGRAPTIAGTTV